VIRKAMVGVNKEGTGARAFAGRGICLGRQDRHGAGVQPQGRKYEAGKVSERLRDHALFIAFAPADQPKIALAVLVENGGFGASRRRRSRARCSTTTCSASCPRTRRPRRCEEEVRG
jgi:penicillin-binding protein 2